ncbi:hypothetical protein ABLO26_08875 [Neobacillus sp. 179-J 1A1 HS]|uniref:hypothetical protein n=1 Tax=Neobacillus driksii TaxID=3035913 RepID=UPI0035BBA613
MRKTAPKSNASFSTVTKRKIDKRYLSKKRRNKRGNLQIQDINKTIDDLKVALQTESLKSERYEKALCALLKLSQDQDNLIEIITTTLSGEELKDDFVKDALTGAVILTKYFKSN